MLLLYHPILETAVNIFGFDISFTEERDYAVQEMRQDAA